MCVSQITNRKADRDQPDPLHALPRVGPKPSTEPPCGGLQSLNCTGGFPQPPPVRKGPAGCPGSRGESRSALPLPEHEGEGPAGHPELGAHLRHRVRHGAAARGGALRHPTDHSQHPIRNIQCPSTGPRSLEPGASSSGSLPLGSWSSGPCHGQDSHRDERVSTWPYRAAE